MGFNVLSEYCFLPLRTDTFIFQRFIWFSIRCMGAGYVHMNSGIQGGLRVQRKMLDPLGLELWVDMSHLIWMPRTGLKSPGEQQAFLTTEFSFKYKNQHISNIWNKVSPTLTLYCYKYIGSFLNTFLFFNCIYRVNAEFLKFMCVGGGGQSQRTTCEIWFSSMMQIPGFKLTLSGFAAST